MPIVEKVFSIVKATIHLFHFPPAGELSVHGSPSAFVVGLNDKLGVYLSEPGALDAVTADRLQDIFIDVARRGDLDDSKHVAALLRGKHPSDFEIGEPVTDGATNHGTYAGIHEVEIPDQTIRVSPIASGGWTFTVVSANSIGVRGSRGAYWSISEAVRAARQVHAGANIEVCQ